MNGLKKSIILLGIIKENTASSVFTYFSKKEKETLLTEIEKEEDFSKKEKNKTILDFLDHFKQRKRPIFGIELITILIFISCICIAFLLLLLSKKFNRDSLENFIAIFSSTGGIYFFTYPYLSYFTRKNYGKSPLKLVINGKKFGINLIYGVTGAILLFLILILINRIIDSAPIYNKGFLFYLMLISQVLLAPLTEEVFFRRFLYVKILSETNMAAALIITSIAFSFVHMPKNFAIGFLYFLCGMILCGIYATRKNLFPSFFAHALANLAFYFFTGF